MHMADALLSPGVGGTMWAASAGAIAYCSRKIHADADNRKVPLMGVLGAFVFAAQMINFTIPGTGSSGHLGGGLLLAILLGPQAAFITIASVLVIQALFFADGGILALGCNIINMGFFSAFVAYPLIYRKIANGKPGRMRMTVAAVAASVVGMQLGSMAVVLETFFSGVSELPILKFALLMQPIHLAIGVVEGLVTAAVITFIARARSDILDCADNACVAKHTARNVVLAFLAAALVTGGALSWYASRNPDGLEWAVARVTGQKEVRASGPVHSFISGLQNKIALMPDYAFRKDAAPDKMPDAQPHVPRAETSVSGIAGGLMTLAMVLAIGFALRRRSEKG
ncbi:MAG TPA: energy-coupling factor ABC transporter permease [Geobacteraceae bacterium]|nr:energy-coupling factor ABC transporter permease [Geobacteraceae bacterium]